MLQSGKTTSGLNTINVSNVKNGVIFKPPLELQLKFESAVAGWGTTRNKRGSASSTLDRLWSVVLDHAFSGSLTKKWREAHMNQLLEEMEQQARTLAEAQ